MADVIAVGASAGGVEALQTLVSYLPEDLPAAVLVTLHIPSVSASTLPRILARAGPLPAAHAEDGMLIERGHILVAPPDHHLLVRDERVRVMRGPREHGHRPAIDPLFRSLARVYGPRAVAIVLSGVLDDGSAGMLAVRARGGAIAVQDPEEALYGDMPRNAIRAAEPEHVLPLAGLAKLIVRLASDSVSEDGPTWHAVPEEVRMSEDEVQDPNRRPPGEPSAYSCPDCSGVLFEDYSQAQAHFRCRTGHAFSSESLLAERTHELESALWAAVRSLEERADLSRRMAQRAHDRGQTVAATRYEDTAGDDVGQAALIRKILVGGDSAAVLRLLRE